MPRFYYLLLLFLLANVVVLGGFSQVCAKNPNVSAPSPPALARDRRSPISQVPRAVVQGISDEIDRLVEAAWVAEDVRPNRPATDEVFLRRIYLDLVGRIPSYQESRDFGVMPPAVRRQQLIDQLLGSPGYDSHQFNWWADLLRLKQRLPGGNSGATYVEFVKDSLSENRPYDQFVRQLLTATGSPYQRGSAAVGYYLRDLGMPEDNMANTVRLFLGTRLECAQCHDHPFDVWTQKEFYRMVAFTGNLRYRSDRSGNSRVRQLRRMAKQSQLTARQQTAIRRLSKPLSIAVEGSGTGLARLPDDYQYSDGQPNQVVTAKTLFAPDVEPEVEIPTGAARAKVRKKPARRAPQIRGATEIDSREAYAQWVTSPENQRFAQVMANRLWKRAMGRGLFEPVDNLNDETEIVNPRLLDYLSDQLVALDYDLRQLQRAIFNSKTYQRQATTTDVASDQPYHFPGPLLRRMSGEQIWDSLLTLAIDDLDDRTLPARGVPPYLMMGEDIYDSFSKLEQMTPQEIIDWVKSDSASLDKKGNSRSRRRAKQEMAEMQEARGRRSAEMATRLRDLRRQVVEARRTGDREAMRQVALKRDALRREDLARRPRHVSPQSVRASELPSPARPGHFVRQFGQSDREQIENSFQEGSVTQALALMNGQIEQKILGNRNSVLMKNIFASDDHRDRITVVFQSMLQRPPTSKETRTWLGDFSRDARTGAADLVWTLGNSHEFLFVR